MWSADIMRILCSRYYSDEMREHIAEPESNVVAREVRGLPDVLGESLLVTLHTH